MKAEDFEVFLKDFCDFLDGLEAAVASLKQQMAKLVGVSGRKHQSLLWNPDRIKWQRTQGSRGEFERSEDFNNPEFKTMLKDLVAHNGRLTREGWFYWVFKNGSTVGRKRRE